MTTNTIECLALSSCTFTSFLNEMQYRQYFVVIYHHHHATLFILGFSIFYYVKIISYVLEDSFNLFCDF